MHFPFPDAWAAAKNCGLAWMLFVVGSRKTTTWVFASFLRSFYATPKVCRGLHSKRDDCNTRWRSVAGQLQKMHALKNQTLGDTRCDPWSFPSNVFLVGNIAGLEV